MTQLAWQGRVQTRRNPPGDVLPGLRHIRRVRGWPRRRGVPSCAKSSPRGTCGQAFRPRTEGLTAQISMDRVAHNLHVPRRTERTAPAQRCAVPSCPRDDADQDAQAAARARGKLAPRRPGRPIAAGPHHDALTAQVVAPNLLHQLGIADQPRWEARRKHHADGTRTKSCAGRLRRCRAMISTGSPIR